MRPTGLRMVAERFLAWVLIHSGIKNLVTMPRIKGDRISCVTILATTPRLQLGSDLSL